jgi:putative ABC transport system permease protein
MDGPVSVTLRHNLTAAAMTSAVRAAVTAIDPAMPVYQMRTFEQLVAESLLQQRLTAGVSVAFAIVAVLLASIGLYGLMSFVVARHEREIGVRMALGADASRVLRSTLRVAMTPVAGGLIAGTIAAVLIGPTARPFLFDVSPTDPATIVATIAVLRRRLHS